MSGLLTAIGTGIVAFSATNIDDIVILLLFFSQVNSTFRRRHIVTGQYLGFTALVLASIPGFLGSLLLPRHLIGLLGMIPLTMGLKRLVNREEDSPEVAPAIEQSDNSLFARLLSWQTYSVAAVTIANGTDNISVYLPLFANSTLENFIVIVIVFFLLIAVWCYGVNKLSQQDWLAVYLTSYGNYLVPFVLIGLGAFLVLNTNSLSILKLVASCFCLVVLVKNYE